MIKQLNFFKTTNKFVCINFDRDVFDKINKNDHPGLKIIHIFVFDWTKIDIEKLHIIAPAARRRNVTTIIHCFDKHSKNELHKRCKDIKKDNLFHFRLEKNYHVFKFMLTPYQKMMIQDNVLIIVTDGKEQVTINTITNEWRK